MPPAKKAAGPTPVEAIVHGDKRANLPTADAYEYVTPDIDQPITVSYPRNIRVPMLVWQGKEELDQRDLAADAPPIYIQEKIDPRVIIENLRDTAKAGEPEPELRLFETFDGLEGLDLVEFYRHDANWSNRMILGDSLQVMASLDSRERLRGKVQMIYMDPPYGIKFGSNWQVSARRRDVKDGKVEDIAREVEQIKAFRDTWELGINSYLTYLRERLTVARELLTESGSIFVQIGDENVHRVRDVLDEVFGNENFVSQIAYTTTSSATSDLLPGTTDYVLWFAKERTAAKWRPLFSTKEVGGVGASKYDQVELSDGSRVSLSTVDDLPPGARVFRLDNLTSQSQGRAKGEGAASWFPVTLEGRVFRPTMQSRWKTNEAGMERLVAARRVAATRNTLSYVRYLDDFPAFALSNSWTDLGGIQSRADPKVYVVQTNTRVIERCLLMTTDPGDLVLDPTCGSGTTAYVAEQWGRRWMTVDTSRVALALARQRLMGTRFPYYILRDSKEGCLKEAVMTNGTPSRDNVTNDIRQGFVYERVRHITLKSITSNPDVKEGLSREEIDEAIRRHAEYEELVDRPYIDNKKVRVTGPFTVESLSPHRALAFASSGEPVTVREAATDPDAPTFEQTILDNLRAAGVQNGRRHEKIVFEDVESYAGIRIQAVGTRADAAEGTPRRIGIAIGPQYGTVDPKYIKEAALEATRAPDVELICVLGFAFDPQALGSTDEYSAGDESFDVAAERALGRVPVLLVRMNADLLMGEDLKKTGAGNLFTVFGEPDLELREVGDEVLVEVKGVDVFDPTTGDVRSRDTDHIALWMIDSDYNGESFFVRHCYFTGGGDPYRRLRQALKADIDESAWSSLYRTESRPFPRPSTGKIAVKVINDYGDEVVKILEV